MSSRPALEPQPTPRATSLFREVQAGRLYVPTVVHRPTDALPPVESTLMAEVDGRRTIAELSQLCDLTPREVLHVVLRLVDAGILSLTTPGASEPPPQSVEIDDADLMEEDG